MAKLGNKEFALPESFDRDEPERTSSDRSFGFVFTGFFLLVGLAPLIHGRSFRLWAVIVAAAFLAVSLTRPALLAPLNRVWTRFGLLLHKIVNPIVMGGMFFVAILPIGWLMRMLGKDPLKRTFDPVAASYWIERKSGDPKSQTMINQF